MSTGTSGDLCVLGIGENGHLAFNDPPANFGEADWVKVVDLDERSRQQQVGEGHFDRLDEVPTQAITLIITGLRSAATMLCLAPERRKAEAVRRTLTGPIDGTCPASILRRTPPCTALAGPRLGFAASAQEPGMKPSNHRR